MLEKDIELNFIEVLKTKGYKYLDDEESLESREYDKNQPFFNKTFEDCLRTINPGILQDEVNKIIRKIQDLSSDANPDKKNSELLKIMKNGFTIRREKEQINKLWKIIDFDNVENNEFIVTNQFRMNSKYGKNNENIPDIVIFINGLPIIVGELKTYSELNTSLIEEAIYQITNYAMHLPDLFATNIFSFVSNLHEMLIGNPISKKSTFNHWRENDKQENVLESDFWNKKNILEIFKNFVFYDKNLKKIIPRYYQYYTVKKTLDVYRQNSNKLGIVWHTQGSGKSLTMVMLTRMLRQEIAPNLTVLVVTDRLDLQNQLFDTFNNSAEYLLEKPTKIEKTQDIINILENTKVNGIYFANIQKFRDNDFSIINKRDDILIITDEAHRSHNSYDSQSYKEIFKADVDFDEYKRTYARILRDSFPNAKFIGFTGTPIETKDVETKRIFGDYIDEYRLVDALQDKTIVDIFYEDSKIDAQLSEEQLKLIDDIDEEETNIIYQNENIKLKKQAIQYKNRLKIKEIQNFIFSSGRVTNVVKHFIQHYERRKKWLYGKAMFVAFNREVAYKYYKEIINQRPDFQDKVKLVVTTNSQKDKKEFPEMHELLINQNEIKIIKDFKDVDSEVKILIVVDKLLTGFDVPALDVIYIDKILKMHNLMQAIARVNRTFKKGNQKKENGLIVDYIGIYRNLQDALDFYWDRKDINNKNKKDITIKDSEKNVEKLKKLFLLELNKIYKLFFNETKIEEMIANNSLFNKTINAFYFNSSEEELNKFMLMTNNLKKNLNLVFYNLTKNEKIMVKNLFNIYDYIAKKNVSSIDWIKWKERNQKDLDSALIYEEILPNYSKEKINFEWIHNRIQRIEKNLSEIYNLKADMVVRAVQTFIDYSQNISKTAQEKYSKKLREIYKKFMEKNISYEEFIKQLNEIIEKINLDNNDNLSQEEILVKRFMDVLFIENEYEDKDTLQRIAKEIYQKLTNNGMSPFKKGWIKSRQKRKAIISDISWILHDNNWPPTMDDTEENQIIKNKANKLFIDEIERVIDNETSNNFIK
ncbi:type I restriction endonuclease subunit R [Mesomycoplasma neurolyticum]|uniref:Type I restriction enzyme endonuclease subunit n=1 Tax=Mesomycoplasma neurolyticum TaxID=2120 RepID=A0A449A4V2_9BACT|nr:HsdR family type I site-specific deoxyribonuclease [Mesomycoplasma neurolyticum]VEU59267.1 Type-1 restriction enzyme R protein [Mesomycoplasma neurolyticum]